jgi:hypothetical protein
MKRNLGVYLIAGLVALNILLWILLPPANLDAHAHVHETPVGQQVAEMISPAP